MPDVEVIETFRVLGKDFRNTKEIVTHIENRIGKMIDTVHPSIPPKQALQMLDVIIANRNELTTLLNVYIDRSDESVHHDRVNVLTIHKSGGR